MRADAESVLDASDEARLHRRQQRPFGRAESLEAGRELRRHRRVCKDSVELVGNGADNRRARGRSLGGLDEPAEGEHRHVHPAAAAEERKDAAEDGGVLRNEIKMLLLQLLLLIIG